MWLILTVWMFFWVVEVKIISKSAPFRDMLVFGMVRLFGRERASPSKQHNACAFHMSNQPWSA